MTSENPRAVIFGLAGKTLTAAERNFFTRVQPLGFILFSRNIENPEQVQALVDDLRKLLEHPQAPILIDQEGGIVARLNPPHWRLPPAAAVFGQLAEDDPQVAARMARDNAWLIGCDLKKLGISVNCAPCLDINAPQAHPIIGDRAFSYSPDVSATLALQAIHGFLEAGITPVLKHLPGHGRATADSHEAPAPVHCSREDLMATDFRAFRLVLEHIHLAFPQYSPWGMTAHVTYADIDAEEPATHSPTIIDGIIRGNIGFRGFLISDCITMKALTKSLSHRANRTLEAGCDAVLHCSGKLDEMIEVASQIKSLGEESWRRYEMSLTSGLPLRQEDENTVLQEFEDTLRYAKSNFDGG
jgi:beta-N-acetylhexosaminidase